MGKEIKRFVTMPLDDGTFRIERWNATKGAYEPYDTNVYKTEELAKDQLEFILQQLDEE